MLTIHKDLIEKIFEHAFSDAPIEVCGVISGPSGSDLPLRHIPMKNEAKSEVFFQFSSREQLQVWRAMDDCEEEPVVIYHSHTNSRAFPSKEDITYAHEPNSHYVIVPTNPEFDTQIRSFRILEGKVTEERVNIVEKYENTLSSTS